MGAAPDENPDRLDVASGAASLSASPIFIDGSRERKLPAYRSLRRRLLRVCVCRSPALRGVLIAAVARVRFGLRLDVDARAVSRVPRASLIIASLLLRRVAEGRLLRRRHRFKRGDQPRELDGIFEPANQMLAAVDSAGVVISQHPQPIVVAGRFRLA